MKWRVLIEQSHKSTKYFEFINLISVNKEYLSPKKPLVWNFCGHETGVNKMKGIKQRIVFEKQMSGKNVPHLLKLLSYVVFGWCWKNRGQHSFLKLLICDPF